MPGILGHVSIVAPPETGKLLIRMAETMQREPNHRSSVRDVSNRTLSAGFGCVDIGLSSGLAEQDGMILVFFGYIAADSLDERLRGIPMENYPPFAFATPAEKLLAIYRHCGAEALCHLNGLYTAAVWDNDANELNIVNDRLGMQPLYFWHAPGRLVFSTELKAILAYPGVNREVDPRTVFDLFTAGHPLDDRTLYRDVLALPPATLLTYRGGSPQMKTYWTMPLYQHGEQTIPEAAYVAQFTDLVEQAVRRIPDDHPRCLLLTGGLDSRLLAGMLARTNHTRQPLLSNTIGHNRALDQLYAAQLAAELGFDHSVLPINPRYVADYAEKTAVRTEGSMNSFASWIFGEDEYLRQHKMRYLITGVGAEGISGRHMLAEHNDPDPENAVQYLLGKHWQAGKAAGLFKQPIAADLHQAALDSYRRSMQCAPSDDPISRYDYVHFRQHRRHPTGNLLHDHALAIEPFHDNDLMDFALRIPPALRTRFYKAAIARAFPNLARIATTGSSQPLIGNLRLPALPGIGLVKRAERAIARRLQRLDRSLPVGDNPTNTVYYNHWLRTESRGFVTQLLSEASCYDDLFEVKKVRRLLDDHMSGRKNEYRLICAMVTFVQMRQLYG